MNAFATACHHLRTNCRRFRYFIVVFFLVNLAGVLAERIMFTGMVDQALFNVFRMLQIFLFPILVIQVFLADSIADDRAQWWTRPISRGALLASQVSYVVVALWLPMALLYLGAWIHDGFNIRQLILATLELAFYTAFAASLAAAMASVSRNYWYAWGVLAVVICATMFSTLAIRFFPLQEKSWWWQLSVNQAWIVVMGILLALSVTGCLMAYLWRRPRLTFLCLLPIAGFPFWLPDIKSEPVPIPQPHPSIEVVRPSDDGSPEAVLAGNLALQGMPTNHFVVPAGCDFTFNGGPEAQVTFHMQKYLKGSLRQSQIHSALEESLRRQFQSLTFQTDSYGRGPRTQITSSKLRKDVPGRLEGNVRYVLYEILSAGTVPLSDHMQFTKGGHVLRLARTGKRRYELETEFQWHSPSLLFSRHTSDAPRSFKESWPHSWVVALEFPDTGDVVATVLVPRFLGGPFWITRHGNGRMNLSLPADAQVDQQPPKVHAFHVSPRTTHQHQFAWDDHRVHIAMNKFRDGRDIRTQEIEEPTPEPQELLSVADLVHVKQEFYRLRSKQRKTMSDKIQALLLADIPASLAGAPWQDPVHDMMMMTLGEKLEESHRPLLRDAIRKDPRLYRFVEKQDWSEAFREDVTRELAIRDPNSQPALIRLAAGYRDSQLYEDLRWHFIHGRRGQKDSIYPLLENLPGFEARATLEEAWQRARRTGQEWSLWNLALRHGLPDGLAACLRQIIKQGMVKNERHSLPMQAMRKATGFEGSTKEFYTWIQTNAGNLKFNPATGRYEL